MRSGCRHRRAGICASGEASSSRRGLELPVKPERRPEQLRSQRLQLRFAQQGGIVRDRLEISKRLHRRIEPFLRAAAGRLLAVAGQLKGAVGIAPLVRAGLGPAALVERVFEVQFGSPPLRRDPDQAHHQGQGQRRDHGLAAAPAPHSFVRTDRPRRIVWPASNRRRSSASSMDEA